MLFTWLLKLFAFRYNQKFMYGGPWSPCSAAGVLPLAASAIYVSPIPSPQAVHYRSDQAVHRKMLIILIPKTSLCSLLN